MAVSFEDVLALEAFEEKVRGILPASYADSYEDVLPTPMGSAPLQYGVDGRVAWDSIWGSFCNLAMAGGPPHRGSLLEPASHEDVARNPVKYSEVVDEISRGISMVTGQPAAEAAVPGWVALQCSSVGMAAWLTRAIVMENVMARHDRETLYLPAGPEFRLQKEIKNVVTVTAKTNHYWTDHMPDSQRKTLDETFSNAAPDCVLLEPASRAEVVSAADSYRGLVADLAAEIETRYGFACFAHRYPGWIGIQCANVASALWLTRAMVVEDVLARREQDVLFLPIGLRGPAEDWKARLLGTFARMQHLCLVKKIS